MDNITAALKEALEKGSSFDDAIREIIRGQVEKATNDILRAELSEWLGYEKSEQGASAKAGDSRNGSYERKLVTQCGTITVSMPRGRKRGFESAVAPRYARKTDGVAELVKALYRQNMTTSEIEGTVELMLGKKYAESTILSMAEGLKEDVDAFRARALPSDMFAIFADATYVPLRRGSVEKEAIIVVIGIDREGYPTVLYLAITPTETKTAWKDALSSIKSRGVERCDVVVSDGFVGMKEVAEEAFPGCRYQRCFVHLARNVADYARPCDKQSVMAGFMALAKMGSREEAEKGLEAFAKEWESKYPKIAKWAASLSKDDAFAFYAFRPEVRYVIYTNNRIEAFNSEIKRASRKHIQWVKEDAEERFLVNLANDYNLRRWKRRVKCWRYLDDPLEK